MPGSPPARRPSCGTSTHPERIEALHQSLVDAGADIILTNTFGGTRHRLKLHNAQDRVRELNKRAAAARPRRRRPRRPPGGRRGLDRARPASCSQPLARSPMTKASRPSPSRSKALAEGGADVLWIETMSAPKEKSAPRPQARRQAGLPYVSTVSFDTAGRTMMGVTPAEHARLCRRLLAAAARVRRQLRRRRVRPARLAARHDRRRPARTRSIVAKGNCGIPEYRRRPDPL